MDYSLHTRIRAGDPEAFRELFRDHARLVHRHAVRVTGDWTVAEDIVSLTFLEAWRLRARLRDEGGSPRPWLMGIAVNVLRNTTRAARRHRQALERLPAKETVPDFADELVGRIADADELAAAQRALKKLRRGEREVFTLCVWSGLGYAEVAAVLGVPGRRHQARHGHRIHRRAGTGRRRRAEAAPRRTGHPRVRTRSPRWAVLKPAV
ncbi:RNA polymerase sigma factor [Streptomyces sp. NPDC013157]|uniref:RNA polymerase sigma factor n=1 Tax=Streptomyces sp. NPDC013157 TaxID=3364861 RepID=UPI00367916D6